MRACVCVCVCVCSVHVYGKCVLVCVYVCVYPITKCGVCLFVCDSLLHTFFSFQGLTNTPAKLLSDVFLVSDVYLSSEVTARGGFSAEGSVKHGQEGGLALSACMLNDHANASPSVITVLGQESRRYAMQAAFSHLVHGLWQGSLVYHPRLS